MRFATMTGLQPGFNLSRTATHKITSLLIAVVGLVVVDSAVEAAPINKCVVNGTITTNKGLAPPLKFARIPRWRN